jgi:alanine dehydrogenase
MKPKGTLLLTRHDIATLLAIEDYLEAMERVFRLYGEGRTSPPGLVGVPAGGGGFHIKAGLLELEQSFFAAKVNANFSQNVKRFGLPIIQGVVILCDGENGYPLALMDSMEITIQRTAATTAVAAKYLARPESNSVTICGCGNQGRASLRALSKIFPIEHVFAYDTDDGQAQQFSIEMLGELRIKVDVAVELGEAVRRSDICITCTPSTHFYLKQEFVRPGTFVAAVGADSESKQELEPSLLAQNKTVVDVLEQCALIGELHHAIAAGLMTRENVHAGLGEVIAGIRPGRTSSEEITIFDSTGMALQDVIAAAKVYETAITKNAGKVINFAN